MSEISGLRIGDRVRLVTELYKVYSEFHPESFDKFYFWGRCSSRISIRSTST